MCGRIVCLCLLEYEEVLASFKQTSNPSPSQTAPSRSDPTVFNFMYNKNTLQQTELKVNSICPWCSLDCNHLYPLLKHMSLCHPRFLFTYSVSISYIVYVYMCVSL